MNRPVHRLLAWVALATVAAGCDELTVDEHPLLVNPEIQVACRDAVPDPDQPEQVYCQMSVGEVDTLQLTFLVGGESVTGLRLHWRSLDPQGISIRGGAEFTDSATYVNLSPRDYLGLSRKAEVVALERGWHEIEFQIDSAGLEQGDLAGCEANRCRLLVRVLESWQEVSAGQAHTCALTYSDFNNAFGPYGTALRPGGEAFCWGDGLEGALGTGGFSESTPTAVSTGLLFGAIAAGGHHTCATALTGFAYCWGSNGWGQLGVGNTFDQFAPQPLVDGIPYQLPSPGDRFTCGIPVSLGSDQLQVAAGCWGMNVEGQLGCDDGTGGVCQADALSGPSAPVISGDGGALFFSQVTAGDRHACGLDAIGSPGTVWCWGDDSFGQLGAPSTSECSELDEQSGNTVTFPCSRFAVRVEDPADGTALEFAAVSAGGASTCGLVSPDQDGRIYCWGRNDRGQLGDGTGVDSARPVRVGGGQGAGWAMVSAGGTHACALDANGVAYCWGDNSDGQLGNGSTDASAVPVAVAGDLRFSWISAGANHTCGVAQPPEGSLTAGGPIYCWGDNQPMDPFGSGGKLGNGGSVDSSVPVRISEPAFR